jgi:hypothetical protein
MNVCLKEQTLLHLRDNEGNDVERAHLTECEVCARRYRQLGSDLEAITRTLRDTRLPETVRSAPLPWNVRWLSAAVMAAWAIVVIWQGVRIWSPPARPPVNEEAWSIAEEFSPEFFTQNQPAAEELWLLVAEAYDRAAALEIDRPCEWYDMPARAEADAGDTGAGDFNPPVPTCVEVNRL